MKANILLLSAALVAVVSATGQVSPITVGKSTTRHGPEKGSLIIIGGGGSTPEIWKKFVELAGGLEKANVVVVTTAVGDSAATSQGTINMLKKATGIQNVTLLHTGDLATANSEAFVEPIRKATAVFFDGGRQWRPADSYLNTLAHQAFLDLLDRGGVIAGSSAGATIQGSFLWRGDTEGPEILIGDHTQGLGFLKNSVIDQHLLARNRQFDMVDFIRQSPELIGIGLDQATAILVQRDTLEVIGKSYVAIYDAGSKSPFFFLSQGDRYDLAARRVIAPSVTGRPKTDNED